MRTFLLRLSLFLPIAAAAYVVLICLGGLFAPQALKPNINYRIGAYGHMFSRLNEARTVKGSIDVLFLGSSHAYRGFDTRNFLPQRAFNLGSSAQTPVQTQLLLDRYLDRFQPRTVIYEVYPGTFASDGVESSVDIIANDRNDLRSMKMALTVNNIKVYNTLIYGTFRDVLHLNRSFSESSRKGDDEYIPGGFVEKKISYFKHLTYPEKKWDLRKTQLKEFEEILSVLEKRNVRVVLVYAPITRALYKSYTNNGYVDSLMNSYGVEYLNMNNMNGLDDSLHFYDPHHLNQHGVNIFNQALKERLSASLQQKPVKE